MRNVAEQVELDLTRELIYGRDMLLYKPEHVAYYLSHRYWMNYRTTDFIEIILGVEAWQRNQVNRGELMTLSGAFDLLRWSCMRVRADIANATGGSVQRAWRWVKGWFV